MCLRRKTLILHENICIKYWNKYTDDDIKKKPDPLLLRIKCWYDDGDFGNTILHKQSVVENIEINVLIMMKMHRWSEEIRSDQEN